MSNYSVLKQDINNNIYENQTQQITGTVLNAILNEMTASLGAGYQFAGVATLGMNPGDPDQRVFYLAGEGIYTSFGGIQVPAGKLGVLKWDNRWTLQTIDGLGGGGANLTGYVSVASTDDLPDEGVATLGYLCGENLYLYVGEGGDTKEGKYQNCGSFRGPQGLQGEPGVGIATVTQTTTSTEDEGINVITVTKEDGTQSTFQVRNGSKGSQGIQGPQGVQGEPGRLQAQYKEVETLPTASADTVDYIYLVASQTPNTYDMYYTEENQGAYSWKSLGTTAVQLSDYATKAEVSQLEAKVVSFCGSETLIQYSTSRLVSKIYPKANYQYFARLWLSDDVNYECIVIAGNTPNPNAPGVVFQTSWGADKETTQTAILSCTLDYCWMFVRDKNNTSGEVLPEQVWLNGWFFADYINTNEETIAEIRSQVAGTIVLPISQGHWTKYPTTAGVPGLLERRTTNAKRMASTDKFYNNGNSVSCSCKNGYQCNIYYVNEATGAEYLTGWAQENSAQKTNAEFNVFAIIIKRTDDADVTASDLDCIESFIYHSDLSDLEVRVESLEQTVNEKYADRPANGYEEFTVSVDTSVPDTDGTALSLQDTQTFENDKGKIYLPTSYSATGNPTRLIIHCHGASQNYNNGTVFPKASSLVTIDYLLAKGYAVMDVNGLPGTHSFYATTCGNPVAYRSYLAAYKWAVTKYNLHKDIFVVGISSGSVPALQISQIETIPVLACVTYCGIMDFSRGWMLLGGYHPNSQGPDIKGYLADKFAFAGTRPTLGNIDPCSDAEWEYVISNWAKFSGWNPYTMGISSTITREEYRTIVSVVYGSELPDWINEDYSFESVQKMLLSFKIPQRGDLSAYQTAIAQEQKLFDTCSVHRKVPLKMFHATNDDVAPYRYSKYFYEMCKRGGSMVEFRTFASGGHNPTGDTQNVTVGGVSITTNTLSLEVLDWLQRFE